MDADAHRKQWLLEWGRIWKDLLAVFPAQQPSSRAVALYADHLADLPIEHVRAAAEQCMASCRFLPTIAELREAARLVVEADEPTALDVYGATIAEISEAKAYSRPIALDPVAWEVVRAMGGPHTLLASDNGPADRARFIECYREKIEARARRAGISPRARALIGPPAPERRSVGFLRAAAAPRSLPPAPEPGLTAAEAERLLAELHARHPRSDAWTSTGPLVVCDRCALEYAPSLETCPRCRIATLTPDGGPDAA